MQNRADLLGMLYLAAGRRVSEAEESLRQSAEEIFRGRRQFSDSELARLSTLDETLDREKDRLQRIEKAMAQRVGT